MSRRHACTAFTLVEVLLVVALISLLISLLLPNLKHSRELARRAVCASNMHQYSVALDQYVNAFRRRYPGGNATLSAGYGIDSTYAVSSSSPMGLAFLITEKFAVEPNIFYCPSWTHPWNQFDVVDVAGDDPYFGPNQMGGWPAAGKSGPTSHRGFSYHYRSTFGTASNRPPSQVYTLPGDAIVADHFVRREVQYGSIYGHRDGYNALTFDGRVIWKSDPRSEYMITMQPPPFGTTSGLTNGQWSYQEIIWNQFFD